MSGERGFSLVEVIVVLAITVVVILGMASLFDSSNHLNKTELQSSELQQSLRAAMAELQRSVRMAGVGDLPVTQSVLAANPAPPNDSYNNVPAGTSVTDLFGTAHPVRPGTDLIEIRGVITTPLFALSSAGCGACNGSPSPVAIPATTPYQVRNNDSGQFGVLAGALTSASRLFVVSSQTDNPVSGGTLYNVGYVSQLSGDPGWTTQASVTADFGNAAAAAFDNPPGAPVPLGPNVRGGILDDIVYFIDDTDPLHPGLAMGQLRSFTPVKYDVAPVAEDIEDLQVSYGVDTNGDGAVGSPSGQAPGDDEWYPNAASESVPAFVGPGGPVLHSVMIGVVAKAAQPDRNYKNRPWSQEIRLMDSTAGPVSASVPFGRKSMTLRVNLRNFN